MTDEDIAKVKERIENECRLHASMTAFSDEQDELTFFKDLRALLADHERLEQERVPVLSFATLREHNIVTSNWNVQEWGCAIAGEVGELCNFLKKVNRAMPGDPTLEQAQYDIAMELADVVIYADLIANVCGIDLGLATREKFNQKATKFGKPLISTERVEPPA